jgi:ATP-dependent exoDNAse (exonuclease V) beta subunit
MPVVLPEMSSKLDESLFAVQAKMEKASDWLDGVNLLYVAFTRAVDALFIMTPEVQGTGRQRRQLRRPPQPGACKTAGEFQKGGELKDNC